MASTLEPPVSSFTTMEPTTQVYNSSSEPTFSHDEIMDAILGIEHHEEDQHTAKGAGRPNKRSGIFASCSNLINFIVGAGIIGMPYAMKNSGLIAGVLLLILVGFMTDRSLRMLVDLGSYHPSLREIGGVHTYEDLASFAFGHMGSNFILFNVFFISFGGLITYLLIIKDTIPTIIGWDEEQWQRQVVLIVTSLTIVVPLSMQRDMSSLAFTSLISVAVDIFLIFFVTFFAPIRESVSEAGGLGAILNNEWIKPSTLFIGLGVLSDAIVCQHATFIISDSLANRTRARWAAVTSRSIAVATIATGIIGICGYLGFLDQVQGDVLNNFDPDSWVANTARGMLAFTMFFTYPVESFVARHVLIKIIHKGDIDGGEAFAEAVEDNSMPGWKCFGRRQLWTLVIYVLSLIPALFFDDVGPVLSICGALGASCVAYMAPGLIFLGVHGQEFLEMITNTLTSKQDSSKAISSAVAGDLPLEGDAKADLQSGLVSSSYKEMTKPWWWYPLLMPIWCSIAETGRESMRLRIAEHASDLPTTKMEGEVEDEPLPRCRDFCVAVFFVLFGVIGLVAGLASNVVVQLNDYLES